MWCLGDVVGYGPDPNECIDLLRTLPHVCLAGNHDWAVLGKLGIETFHENAAFAVQWTREHLSPQNLTYLKARPEQDIQGDYLLVHASPREPIWEYVIDVNVAEENFGYDADDVRAGGAHACARDFCQRRQDARPCTPRCIPTNAPVTLKRGSNYIINPGSVGQPRDGDPRAAYAILDTEAPTWTQYRTEYPIKRTQDKMRAAEFSGAVD